MIVNDQRMPVYWDGFNCDGIYELLGHWDWAHKNGVLLVKNSCGIAYIPKGQLVEIDEDGKAISKTAEDEVDESVLDSAKKKWRTPERRVSGCN